MEMDFSEREYNSLIEEIFKRFPSVQKARMADAYKPGLDGMAAFDEELGFPDRKFRSIHVAGTNGKGSVANMLASALSAVGMKVGLYTSPHIRDFRERMRIGKDLVPKEYVFEFLNKWKPYFIEKGLSFFEITTGLAFKWFSDEGVDVAVIETGLGGRLDSTNIITPELSIITSIGLDHCEYLGNTLAEIASEKAGIMKSGVPALIGESSEETDPVFIDAAWMNCSLTFADKVRPSLWYARKDILRKMDLQGSYQEKNLRTVLAAVDILKEMSGFKALSDSEAVIDAIIHTASRMDFHGRWEKLSDLPYIICDIGHNAAALKYNFAQLEEMVSEGRCSSLIVVYGIMADKDLDSILPLMPSDATFIFTAADTPRSLPAEKLLKRYQDFCKESGRSPVRAYSSETVREAVRMAIMLAQNLSEQTNRSASAAKPAPVLIYIGGSTYVVSEAIQLF